MGPVLLKLLREAILGSHELAKARHPPAAPATEAGFSPLTAVLGLLAKFADADGRVSALIVGEVEEILIELGLVGPDRRETMGLFHAATESLRSFEEMLGLCRDFTRDNVWLRPVLLSLLFRLAHAEGSPSDETTDRLRHACALLGRDYQESLNYFRDESAQRAFERRWAAARMKLACAALGCDETEPLEAIKRRYRALAKELHPDLATARGLPDKDIQLSAEKFREVQEAYQVILGQREPR